MATINTYLNFKGNTLEAFQFYQKVFGGEFTVLQRFKDMPPNQNCGPLSEGDSEKIMHVSLPIGKVNSLMGSDIPESMEHGFILGNNFSISISPDSEEQANLYFQGLSKEGTIIMPLEKVFWGSLFGMVQDKFGVHWMVNYDSQNK